MVVANHSISVLANAVGATAFYAVSLWRIFKRYPGNRVIECGLIAIMVVLSMAFFSGLGEIPDWLFGLWLVLILLLCLSTLFFFAQSCVRALRDRRANARSAVPTE